MPETKFRLAKFLNAQRLDPATGRVEGRFGTDQMDGGMALAERYAWQFGVGTDRFWDDLKGLKAYGFSERAVAPAPGRRAVYALCLRADAIPADLPEDLMRELRVWDLPEAEDPFEDAAYGRLTTRPSPEVEPLVVVPSNAETRQFVADVAAAPRWEHPAGTKAAEVAVAIREDSLRLERVGAKGMTPDLRCTAVADPDRAAEMTARVRRIQVRLMTLDSYGKASPLYAKGFKQLSGSSSTGSSDLSWSEGMEKTKTTPSAATGKKVGQAFGDSFSAVARKVVRRSWHVWRRELGRGEVFLPQPSPEELSRSVTGSTWDDLHHTVAVALRRGGTETELVELLTRNLVRRDQWGEIVAKPDNMGRLAAWRLWKFINSRPDAPHFVKRRHVPQAPHVTWWDEATAEQRDRYRARVDEVREERKYEEIERAEAAAVQRAERYRRWGLDRFEESPEPHSEPRRWAQQPEHVHLEELAGQRRALPSRSSREADASWRAAVAQARADKRARKAREGR
ncbi:hypothetical protein [Streptomyces chartreusis]|uniref:hypothetical protein n=1 Tax=Streptomyces chartreusis TaxID=1969 RepID=UPI003D725FDA